MEKTLKKTIKKPERDIAEPPTSSSLLGPREGFIESIDTNVELIKKRLPTNRLKILKFKLGRYTKTKINILYLNQVANENVVSEIYNRLKNIDIDGIIDSYYLVSFLEERPNSIFKQVGQTEKPDVAVSKLLEGRVIIICDGSPIILSLPFLLIEDLQSPDDYYQKEFRVSVIRIIRLLGAFISILLPGIYLAIELYHYKIIPLNLLVALSNSTANLPFGPLVEILFVLLLFEILYEANLRMPRYLGMALSIVGAIILGNVAVQSGFISPPAVMIVAMSGITIYTIPNEAGQLSLLRFFYTLIGAMFSLFGIILFSIFLVIYLCNFYSYKVSYLAPLAPYIKCDQKDAILKQNLLFFNTRPESLKSKNKTRLSEE